MPDAETGLNAFEHCRINTAARCIAGMPVVLEDGSGTCMSVQAAVAKVSVAGGSAEDKWEEVERLKLSHEGESIR